MYCVSNILFSNLHVPSQNVNMWQNTVLIGVSLSKPHVDRGNGPRTRNNGTCMSSVYHLLCVCHTQLVPKIRVRPEMLHIFCHIEVLMCMIYNLTEQQG